MAEPSEEAPKTYDGSIGDLVKSLINSIIKDSEDTHGATPLDKIRNQLKFQEGSGTFAGITALSSYMQARAAERQATSLEALAKTASKLQVAEAVETDGQAIVDLRSPRREYLATTYSLPTEVLSLLWAMRGILVDASIKALSRPGRFDPYRRVSTEELAWSLRMSDQQFLAVLPKTAHGKHDYGLLEDFDIMHYGGDDEYPDEWIYGG